MGAGRATTPIHAARQPSRRGPPGSSRYGQFARAVAARYSGSVPGFPRVRLWRAWNEPNLSTFLLPQFSGRQALSPTLYRNMLNAFAAGAHAVHPDNVVVAMPVGRGGE